MSNSNLVIALIVLCVYSGAVAGYYGNSELREETVNGKIFQIGNYGVAIEDDGNSIFIELPYTTNAMLKHYRADIDKTFDYVVDTTIGATTVAEGKIWFGLNFYSGEGHEGIGGVGYFDPITQKFGLLRHPAILDCAIRSIEVTKESISVLTYSAWEYGTGDCKGVIVLDKKTLSYTMYRRSKTKINGHTDAYENPALAKKQILALREGRIGPLVELWEKTEGPAPDERLASLVKMNELEKVRLEQAEFERSWFRGAIEAGRTQLTQHCQLEEVDKKLSLKCDKRNDGDVDINAFVGSTLGGYQCEPGGFLSVWLSTNKTISNGVDAHIYPPGRTYYGGTAEKQQYPIALAGMEWSKYAYGALHILHIDSTEIKSVVCKPPFVRFSGPGIYSMTVTLTVVEPSQTYILPSVLRETNGTASQFRGASMEDSIPKAK
jgi:hypothetical protein